MSSKIFLTLPDVNKLHLQEIYKHIQSIDRMKNGLASNLFPSQIKYHDNQAHIITDESQCEAQVDLDIIKNEAENEYNKNEYHFEDDLISIETQDFPPLEDQLDLNIQINKRKKKDYVKFKRKSPKKSKHTAESESPSDDEPLANKVTKNEEIKDIDITECTEISIPKVKTILSANESTKVKKHNNFNDFEDYAAVIFLTPEEAKKEVLFRKESSNYINSPLKCDLCYRGYEAKLAYENHIKKHSIVSF